MLGSFYQFFSDSLSERTKDRMMFLASLPAAESSVIGSSIETRLIPRCRKWRWLLRAAVAFSNRVFDDSRKLCIDPERAPLVREAFNLVASGRFPTTDAVLRGTDIGVPGGISGVVLVGKQLLGGDSDLHLKNGC